MDVSAAERLLQERIGLDPASAGPGLVARAVRSRMKSLGIARSEGASYLALLEESPSELQSIIEEVVVPESWFFRDDRPFAFLREHLSGRRLSEESPLPLRLLSLPCARGEEPYSIAMMLLDLGFVGAQFRIDAVDLSHTALEAARLGIYNAHAFRSADLSFRDRYFHRTAAGFALASEVKRLVHFRQANILDEGLYGLEPPFDVIFCRNLLIYFDTPSRARAVGRLDRLLARHGILILGHAEQLGILGPQFRPVGGTGSFAFERGAPGVDQPVPKPSHRPARAPHKRAATKTTPVHVEHSVPPARAEAKPGIAASARPVDGESDAAASLAHAHRLADQGRHAEAAELCEADLRRRGPSARTYFLLGVVRQAAGERSQAATCFEKAVYLDPLHEEALLSLALIAHRAGDHAAATNYRRRAGRAAKEKPER
jgi:chemotaxis protein methyltransferase WspC